jgi:riboflavin kinase / FMN adenylyltransferase
MISLDLTHDKSFHLPAALARPVVTIGNFDGVHLGHQALLAAAKTFGACMARPVVLLTFDPHPRRFFRPTEPLFMLTPPAMKARVAARYGADGVVCAAFDSAMAGMSAQSFIDDLLVTQLDVSGIVIGPDFHFGKNRAGSPLMLADQGKKLGFETTIVAPVALGGDIVSSTAIRAALTAGEIATATRLLGHKWCVEGTVAHGDKRGRELGYPTANIMLSPDVTLRYGIYAVRAYVGGKMHDGVASFGRRPTFDNGAAKLEVHLFDFAGDLYDQSMEVSFVGFIRPELKFESVEALVRQMDADSLKSRALLKLSF